LGGEIRRRAPIACHEAILPFTPFTPFAMFAVPDNPAKPVATVKPILAAQDARSFNLKPVFALFFSWLSPIGE